MLSSAKLCVTACSLKGMGQWFLVRDLDFVTRGLKSKHSVGYVESNESTNEKDNYLCEIVVFSLVLL